MFHDLVWFEMTVGSCSGHRKFGIVTFGESAKVATNVATFFRVLPLCKWAIAGCIGPFWTIPSMTSL